MSFHGVPERVVKLGDPYRDQCLETARRIAGRLGLTPDRFTVSFQSRFGSAKWLEPATDATLRSLGARGAARVDVACPGFVADCLETLEEIAMEGRNAFLTSGGKEFRYLPCVTRPWRSPEKPLPCGCGLRFVPNQTGKTTPTDSGSLVPRSAWRWRSSMCKGRRFG